MFSYCYPALVAEGCLISVSRRGAGSGGREIPCIGDAVSWSGGPSREAPGASTLRRGALTAGKAGRLSEAPGPSAWSLNGRSSLTALNRPTPGDLRGANLQTPRAGRLWLWRTCGMPRRTPIGGKAGITRTSTSLDVARRRGPWVLRAPGVPRALGSFRGTRNLKCRRLPAPVQKSGRRSVGWSGCLKSESVRRKAPASHSARHHRACPGDPAWEGKAVPLQTRWPGQARP